MSRYSDTDILAALLDGTIGITPAPHGSDVQPASVELHLAPEVVTDPLGAAVRQVITEEDPYTLAPGECLLVSTTETVALSDTVVGEVWGKSSLARRFLLVHVTAGYIDPGFRGQITLELVNLGGKPFVLRPGMKIAQIAFDALRTPATLPYGAPSLGSHYQDQVGATGSRS